MADLNADSESTLIFRKSDFDDGRRGLFPEDLRAWQPAVRLVKLVEKTAAELPAAAAPNPDARVLAGVLLWCLVTGRYGSWDIEALCAEEPLCRHLAAGLPLTHADIHRYRREHEPSLQAALVPLLRAVWSAAARPPGSPDFGAEAARRYERARQADSLPPESY